MLRSPQLASCAGSIQCFVCHRRWQRRAARQHRAGWRGTHDSVGTPSVSTPGVSARPGASSRRRNATKPSNPAAHAASGAAAGAFAAAGACAQGSARDGSAPASASTNSDGSTNASATAGRDPSGRGGAVGDADYDAAWRAFCGTLPSQRQRRARQRGWPAACRRDYCDLWMAGMTSITETESVCRIWHAE
jgi:hypothetical protein